jgi:peptidoglycan/LPS O-acetylase OafA/YrhL
VLFDNLTVDHRSVWSEQTVILVHPALVLIPLLTAILCSAFLVKIQQKQHSTSRYRTIDGLRGYLAFFVFLHHSAIWYSFAETGQWEAPSSNLLNQFGEAGVSFFFMITGFLFYGKLIDGRGKQIDWVRFFVGRVLRLSPLYFLVVPILMILVYVESHGTRVESFSMLATEVRGWFLFTIFDEPKINGVYVARFLAGVNWSLPYEWYFYLSMPLLALSAGRRTHWKYLLLSAATLIFATACATRPYVIGVFLSGMVAAVVVKSQKVRKFAESWSGSAIVVLCLAMLVWFFHGAYGYRERLLLTIAFILISAGSSLFGILSSKLSYAFGELSYGIYLFHGILLYVCINYVTGPGAIKGLAPLAYWILIAGLVPILITAAALAFRFIELPAMRKTDFVSAWVRRQARQWSALILQDPIASRSDRDVDGSVT